MNINYRLIVMVFLLVLIIYIFANVFFNNCFYKKKLERRARLAATSQGDIRIGIEFNIDHSDCSFGNGVDMAINEINSKNSGRGIFFRSATTNRGMYRKIVGVFHPSRTLSEYQTQSPAAKALAADKRIVAVISDMYTSTALKSMIVYEENGIANIVTNTTRHSLTEMGFQYVIRTVPNSREISKTVNSAMPRLLKSYLGYTIENAGFFFMSQSSPESPVFLEERDNINKRINVANLLRKAFSENLISDKLLLSDLVNKNFLPNGLPIDIWTLDDFIYNSFPVTLIKSGITLKEALNRLNPDDNPVNISFIKGFLPNSPDYRNTIASIGEIDYDIIVIFSDAKFSLRLMNQIREMGIIKPIYLISPDSIEYYIKNNILKIDNLFYTSYYDRNSNNLNYIEFRNKYRNFVLTRTGVPREPEFSSIQGYEAVHLLAEVFEKSGSTVPINIINSLKFGKYKWNCRISPDFRFNSKGDIIGRKLYLMKGGKNSIITISEE